MTSPANKPSSWHIAVAAEAIAAAQFARCGFDASVQYGANQPEYDLVVARGDKFLKVSVKGSQDGGWGLTQSYLEKATKLSGKKGDYHGAIDLWLARHGSKTVFCFVQFQGLSLEELPRIYLASPKEIAQRLKETANGRGDSILYEHYEWTSRAYGAGTIEDIPSSWRFSKQRILDLLKDAETELALKARA